MKFPDSADKASQYAVCADMLADTLTGMGYELRPQTLQGWKKIMHGLVDADVISEQDPSFFSSTDTLKEYLQNDMGIEPNEATIAAAKSMVAASTQSMEATTLREYLDSRRIEALQSVELLRAQTPELDDEPALWEEIRVITTAGIYLDSLFDAKEDAHTRANFSAPKLAIASAVRLVKESWGMDSATRRAAARACFTNGLVGHLIRSLPRKILA